jgi:hypothetical protein
MNPIWSGERLFQVKSSLNMFQHPPLKNRKGSAFGGHWASRPRAWALRHWWYTIGVFSGFSPLKAQHAIGISG